MEQKRTLWIIAAVGVFLLVVLGTAIILYSPSARSAQSIASLDSSRGASSNGWISLAPSGAPVPEPHEGFAAPDNFERNEEVPFAEPERDFNPAGFKAEPERKAGDIIVYTDNVTVNGNKIVSNDDAGKTVINNTTTIDIGPGAPAPMPAEKPVQPKVHPQKPAAKPAAKAVSEKPAVKAASKPAVKPQETKKPEAKPEVPQFWVQVTSLTSRKNADAAREVLADNKINAEVFTYNDAKGQLFYRVRVGPYTTKSEAEYWRSKIEKIDTFKNSKSYVASTKASM